MTKRSQRQVLQAARIVEAAKPLLAGHLPQVIGAALAELLALFLAGHRPDLRDEILKLHIDAVRDLVAPCEHELFAKRSRPKEWPPLQK